MTDLLAALERSVSEAKGRKASGTKKSAKEKAGRKDTKRATKSGLTALTTKLDIPGRSSMTRDQLAAAVRKVSWPRRDQQECCFPARGQHWCWSRRRHRAAA
ncbi:MAG: hypothetical protein ABS81_18660 [Pseudonocardia sp. SCN 72-86]|nr:MAG: hypothetical protein ABS81_18660 [Pseudonocardia sp. SCN 72-86]